MLINARLRPVILLLTCLLATAWARAQVTVWTQHNDNARTGQNLNESVLTTSNVNVANFGKLFTRAVDGYIYAQPLYLPNLNIAGKKRNVVFVATEHNTVYAFDADDPGAPNPLWNRTLDVPNTPVPSSDVCIGQSVPQCPYTDLIPVIGITSTPVIDTTSNTMYVVAKSKDTGGGYHFRLHALDVLSGTEKLTPTEITASVPGTGDGSSGGFVTFNILHQHNRPGLLLTNGTLYIAFGSVGDVSPFHGWVLAYNAATLQRVGVFCTTPNASSGGFWAGGGALATDAAGNVYGVSSNGTFDANVGGTDFGDTILKLSSKSLSLLDYFTPNNQSSLSLNNIDQGSGGPLMIPGTTLLIEAGKDGILHVVDTTTGRMGQFSANANNDYQQFQATDNTGVNSGFMGSPVYWNSPNKGPLVYIWGAGDFLKAYQFLPGLSAQGQFNTSAVLESASAGTPGYSNSVPLSLSANGRKSGTGILWAIQPMGDADSPQAVPGMVQAFDATSLNELWNSNQNASRDAIVYYAKFDPPTVANGKVYVASWVGQPTGSESGQLVVYGLFNPPANPDFSLSLSPASSSVAAGQSATYSLATAAQGGFSTAISFNCSGLPANAACVFNPSTVSPGSTSTMTVTTTGPTARLVPLTRPGVPFYALWLPLPGIVFLGVGFGVGSRRSRIARSLLLPLLCILLGALVACGGGGTSNSGGGTPAGTYTVTVTATAGSTVHTQNVTLIVQ